MATHKEKIDYLSANINAVTSMLSSVCKGNVNNVNASNSALCRDVLTGKSSIKTKTDLEGLSIHQIDILYSKLKYGDDE